MYNFHMAFVCFLNAEVVVSQLWIEIEKQKTCKASDTYKTAKINFITSWAEDIISIISSAHDVVKLIFAEVMWHVYRQGPR